jgi:hypothetical protein
MEWSSFSNVGTAQWILPHQLGTPNSRNFQSSFLQRTFGLIDVSAKDKTWSWVLAHGHSPAAGTAQW